MSYPPPPPPGSYPTGGAQGPVGNNKKAIWALAIGIFGLLCCSPLGIVAIILGNSAKQEIAGSGGMQQGEGMAKAGFILGIVALVLLVVQIILAATGVIDVTGSFDTTS